MIPDCNGLWIGPRLGAVERACLRSVMRQGHRLTLWCYEAPAGVPEGVLLRDAAEILPPERIVRHRNGSPSLFSNLFRYELQRRAMGVWLDCDVYLVKPVPDSLWILAREDPVTVNTGILRMPPDAPPLAPLIALFDEKTVPPWISLRARIAARWRLATTGRSGLHLMPWGVAGPRALTALVRRYGLEHLADPPEVYQPVHWTQADWILDPAQPLESRLAPESRAVHLWNEVIRGFKDAPAPPGSFLARLQEEGA
jgi:hypothetical protein